MLFHEPDRIRLAHLPTPLVRLERLSHELGDAHVWLKRDDLTGLELSGNKIRKLEYVAAAARAGGCDTLITEGTCQSNHCRATAAVCAKLGMQAMLLFRPEPPAEVQGNQLLDAMFGARWQVFPRPFYSAMREQIIEKVFVQLRDEGRSPRFTPAGASEPVGCWGYIGAMRELADQLAAQSVDECDLVLAVSSGGTYAGALLGRLLHKLAGIRLWAVAVSDDVAYHTREIARLCEETIEKFKLPVTFDRASMQFIDGYVGEGYAIPYPEAIAAIRLLARVEGILLDPVYTAKAFHALLDGVRDGRLGRERPVVFLHTGGIFSNFAWPGTLLAE
jgi:D-cysteine desulfhydrase